MNTSALLKSVCVGLALLVTTTTRSPAQTNSSPPSTTFTDLLNFDGANGAAPVYNMSLIQGSNGNLYGTTVGGGTYDDGTIFEVTTAGVVTTLYNFCSKTDCTDGAFPYGGLMQASDGDLYGVTNGGGSHFYGSVFKLSSSNKLTTLHNFRGGTTDGAYPSAGLTLYDGDYYGTTQEGGAAGLGTIFKIIPGGTLTTLYSFCAQSECADGTEPLAGLVQFGGELYGTTIGGGSGAVCTGCGTIFKITPTGTLTTLYSFCSQSDCTDGVDPFAGLVVADGNFYGTTLAGGTYGQGTIFEITPAGTLTVLYAFCSQANCTDGEASYAGLIQGTSGNLYGTTNGGGTYGYGTVFEITTGGTLTTLHDFDITKGASPLGGLLQDTNGTFYGTTPDGGSYLDGTVYSLSVSSKARTTR